jgi:hypothetical protein
MSIITLDRFRLASSSLSSGVKYYVKLTLTASRCLVIYWKLPKWTGVNFWGPRLFKGFQGSSAGRCRYFLNHPGEKKESGPLHYNTMSIFIVCRIFPPSDCWFLWTSDSHSEKIISTRVRAATHRSLRRTWVSIRFVPFSWYFWCVRSECTFVYLSISFNGFVRGTEMKRMVPPGNVTPLQIKPNPTSRVRDM